MQADERTARINQTQAQLYHVQSQLRYDSFRVRNQAAVRSRTHCRTQRDSRFWFLFRGMLLTGECQDCAHRKPTSVPPGTVTPGTQHPGCLLVPRRRTPGCRAVGCSVVVARQ
jgi:hypothetical protein